LREVLPRIEELLPKTTIKQRRPLIALYCLYNNFVPENERAEGYRDVIGRYTDELAAPSMESLAVHLLLAKAPPWPIEAHRELYVRYFDQRNQSNGFRAPVLFEAGFGLALAERLRGDGQIDAARDVLKTARENAAGLTGLAAFVDAFDPTAEIDWGRVLLPSREVASSAGHDGNPLKSM
jgi:hypothetical protein